jgi:CheY-like chemotaxis protein
VFEFEHMRTAVKSKFESAWCKDTCASPLRGLSADLAREAAEASGRHAERNLLPQRSERYLVFVVDDEWIIASTLAAILQQNGYESVYFTQPLAALEAARFEAPVLLISDVMMPEMSGVELAIQLKAISPGCKILLFSGQASTADLLHRASEQGHEFELLSKPVHPTELLKRIGEAVNNRLPS